MTHTQLKSFLAIARYRSFTAAADQLYISQSALSQQMKSLEQELGFTLFDRGSRQLALTEAGRSFYQSALKMQEVYFHAVSEGQQLQRLHQQQLERLCIGCLGGQYFQIWMELLHTALPLLNRYAPPPCPLRKQRCTLHSSAARRSTDRRPPGKRRYCPSWAAVSAFCTGTRTLHAVVPFHGCNDLTAAAKKFCTPRGSAGTTDCVPSSSRQHFI